MKIKTTDAARNLSIHPSHLLLHVAELDSSLTFADVWPEIDTAWVETAATTSGHKRPRSAPSPRFPNPPARTPSLSENAIHVLDKLSRQGRWGGVAVAFDALLNLTHVAKRDLEDVVDELRKDGLLDRDGTGRGTISLNPAKREDIKKLVQQQGRA